MSEMTTRERMKRMVEHKEADRIVIWEGAWAPMIRRWCEEGMGNADYVDFFGLDRIVMMYGIDNSPRLPAQVLEETEEHSISTTNWGSTQKRLKNRTSTPEVLDVAVKDREDWENLKGRMQFDDSRVPLGMLAENWATWREQGAWIMPSGFFGFDVTHSFMVGTERCLIALIEDPEWTVDMWQTQQDLHLHIFDRIWDAGYEFDALRWPDDMGYKLSQFFSLDMYRELLKPIHQRAVDWAHEKGIPAYLHSCGDIRPFIPDLVDMGLDILNPLEVKAGVDPLAVKAEFGDKLTLHGGFNALDWHDVEKMEATVHEWIPKLKEGGGYIFATDHNTPPNVSLADFRRITDTVKEVGRY